MYKSEGRPYTEDINDLVEEMEKGRGPDKQKRKRKGNLSVDNSTPTGKEHKTETDNNFSSVPRHIAREMETALSRVDSKKFKKSTEEELIDKLEKGGPGSGVRGHTTAKKPSELKSKSKVDPLKIANAVEQSGAGFFNRVGNDMIIYVREAHGNDHNQWGNARKIQDSLGSRAGEIVPDPQSGHLYIKVKDVYNK
jgi:hypothetical protein